MLSLKPEILSAPTHIILTPNRREFELLCGLHNIDADSSSSLRDLSLSLPGMTIVLKGATDHAMLDGQGLNLEIWIGRNLSMYNNFRKHMYRGGLPSTVWRPR